MRLVKRRRPRRSPSRYASGEQARTPALQDGDLFSIIFRKCLHLGFWHRILGDAMMGTLLGKDEIRIIGHVEKMKDEGTVRFGMKQVAPSS
jgi:hypothetical protein